jgi:hypothetical protein
MRAPRNGPPPSLSRRGPTAGFALRSGKRSDRRAQRMDFGFDEPHHIMQIRTASHRLNPQNNYRHS